MPSISIKQDFKTYYLNWEVIHQDNRCIRIKVTPLSNPDKFIILGNNAPLIRGKYHLKNRRIDWKLIEGDMRKSAWEMIVEAIVNPPVPEEKILPISAFKATNKRDKGGALFTWRKKLIVVYFTPEPNKLPTIYCGRLSPIGLTFEPLFFTHRSYFWHLLFSNRRIYYPLFFIIV